MKRQEFDGVPLYTLNEIKDYMNQYIIDNDINKITTETMRAVCMGIARRFFLPCDYFKQGNKDKGYIYNIDLICSDYYTSIFQELIYIKGLNTSIELYSLFIGIDKSCLYDYINKLNPSRVANLKRLRSNTRDSVKEELANSKQIIGRIAYLNETIETKETTSNIIDLQALQGATARLIGKNDEK